MFGKQISFQSDSPLQSSFQCLCLAVMYVGSIYIFDKRTFNRDHPSSIKQRIKSVLVVCLLAPLFVYHCGLETSHASKHSIFVWLGCHVNQFLNAVLFPLVLTMILFIGPIVMRLTDNGLEEFRERILSRACFTDLHWYRDYVVAPFTEEFIFRACMLPLMTSWCGVTWSVLLTPLFFGVAHVHHAVEHTRNGHSVRQVIIITLFQTFYTTVFGAYCCFLFLRTGHLIAPVISHSFCNLMGFPDFQGISTSRYPILITVLFFAGLIFFLFLLFPMTVFSLYESIYWR